MENLEELQRQLNESEIKQESKQITANRGRLINKIRAEIKKIKEDGISEEEKQSLVQMEALLMENVADHKDQLNTRYKEEFVQKSGSILSTITALPKGVSLAIEKVKTCIGDLKDAKTNKERVFKTIELLKASGILAATPIIFTGKFLIKHWYLVLLFIAYIFNIPGILFKAGKDTITKNAIEEGKTQGGNLLREFVGQEAVEPDKTTIWRELKERLSNPEELKKIGEDAKQRITNLGSTIKNDYEAIKSGIKLVKKNWGIINSFIKEHYGLNLDGLSESAKEKITSIQNRLNIFKPDSPTAATELNEINQNMYELTDMLEKPEVGFSL